VLTARDRVKVKRALHDPRVDDALSRYESLEKRIDELEANADVFEMGGSKSLEQEFQELESAGQIDADLAQLKARMRERRSS
jgi:phage shock protein A